MKTDTMHDRIHTSIMLLIILLAGFCMPERIWAQHTERSDSLNIRERKVTEEHVPANNILTTETHFSAEPQVSDFTPDVAIPLIRQPESINLSTIGYDYRSPIPSHILRWDSGILTGSNYGYGGIMGGSYTSNMILGQQWDNITLHAILSMSKSHYARLGASNGMGINAGIAYHLGDNARLIAFGGMNTYGIFSANAVRSYHYGGYFSLNTENKKVGMNLGMRRYFDPLSGRWITMPIITPYVNLWGQDVGIDLGYLLMRAIPSINKALNPDRGKTQQMRYDPTIIPAEVRTKGLINMPPVEVPNNLK